MTSSHRHGGWRFLALGLAGIAVVWLAGCLVIPVMIVRLNQVWHG